MRVQSLAGREKEGRGEEGGGRKEGSGGKEDGGERGGGGEEEEMKRAEQKWIERSEGVLWVTCIICRNQI